MEEWRALEFRTRSTLAPIADGTKTFDFLRLVNAAYMKLATYVHISRRILMGATDLELGAIPTPPPHRCSPIDLIERARRLFEVFRRQHATAGHIFELYGTGLGFDQDGDPLWQTWKGHHATAIQNADEALQGLHSAAASCQALVDAYLMATSLPPRSPAWFAWVSAAISITRRAVSAVTTAAVMVRLMRRTVLSEYVAACNLLGR